MINEYIGFVRTLMTLGAVACLAPGCSQPFTAATVGISDGGSGDSGADTGVPGSGDGDAGSERGSPGGAVAPTFGAISTVGPAAGDASAAEASAGGGLLLTDDGFEMGE